METLREAYRFAKRKGGAPGCDVLTFDDIEESGLDEFLLSIRNDLLLGSYQHLKNRKVEIPKNKGKVRMIQIPTIRNRVIQ
jgi:RNA-directed DNA polymerase